MRCFLLAVVCAGPVMALEGFVGDEPTSRLTDFLGDTIRQRFDLEFRFGDVVSDTLFDLAVRDESSFVVSLGYTCYFDHVSLRVPAGYRRESSFSLEAGFGNWGFTFVIPVEYDLYRGGGDVSLALGERALLETGGLFTRIKNFGLLENVIIGRTGLSFFPTDNFSLRAGWQFNRYANPSGAGTNHSSVTAGMGCLWGNAQRGLDLALSYRKRGLNGGDQEADYYKAGADWYATPKLTVSAAFEYQVCDPGFPSADEEGHSVDAAVFLRPNKEFRIGGGYHNHYSRAAANDFSSFFVSMSYAF